MVQFPTTSLKAGAEAFAAHWCVGYHRERRKILEEEARIAAAPMTEDERQFRQWYAEQCVAMDEIYCKREQAVARELDEWEAGKKHGNVLPFVRKNEAL
jgi:hypothetical protein